MVRKQIDTEDKMLKVGLIGWVGHLYSTQNQS